MKRFELSNHLGNVLVTVSDKLRGIAGGNQPTTATHYEASVVSASDYYPFGLQQYGRKVEGDYRYGFNGKENDSEWGSQVIQDYGFRIYNPSLGKFLSVDPLTKGYPWYTPYQFAGNDVIRNVDLDGLEPANVVDQGGYDIKQGDTFYDLNEEWGLEQGTLESYNSSLEPRKLQIGQTIKVTDPNQLMSDHYSDVNDGSGIVVEHDVVTGDFIRNSTVQRKANEKANLQLMQLGLMALEGASFGLFRLPQVSPRGYSIKSLPISPGSQGKRFGGRELIIDENLPPSLQGKLKDEGFVTKIFPKGTLDPDIIKYAQKNNSIVLTNNIKDFKHQDISAIKVSTGLLGKKNIPTVVDKLKNLSAQFESNSSLLK